MIMATYRILHYRNIFFSTHRGHKPDLNLLLMSILRNCHRAVEFVRRLDVDDVAAGVHDGFTGSTQFKKDIT